MSKIAQRRRGVAEKSRSKSSPRLRVSAVSQEPVVPRGFRFAAVAAGIKKSGGLDVALADCAPSAAAAALFTKNLVVAAPILADRIHLQKTRGRQSAVVVNSGNANCATGDAGFEHCKQVCYALADLLGIRPRGVFPSSTGVIGVPLPVENLLGALPQAVSHLAATPDALAQFARAIMTTDTRPKIASAQFACGGATATITGVCKGAGMIHPNMATMLAYIFTDAELDPPALRRALVAASAESFNAISVDGDTSTNDTVLLLASGAAARVRSGADRGNFQNALNAVCASLAEQIVADGEGVQHIVRLRVVGARNSEEARRIANTIATSALVKTAWAGADPNWGRILAAVGRSGVKLDPARVSVRFGPHLVCRRGAAVAFDEAAAHQYLNQPQCEITVDLGRGRAAASVLTCDLTAEYVRINADYRT
jgi:glutamate N-acetyltransferase / amino-acid N-acetyltransferase